MTVLISSVSKPAIKSMIVKIGNSFYKAEKTLVQITEQRVISAIFTPVVDPQNASDYFY